MELGYRPLLAVACVYILKKAANVVLEEFFFGLPFFSREIRNFC